MPYLVIQTGTKPPSRRRFEGTVEVGRGIGPEIWIEDRNASRTHCRIFLQNDGWMIEDLGSTNGTFVGHTRITRQPLRDGEVIFIGETKMVFHLEELNDDRPSRPIHPTELSDSNRIDMNATHALPHLDRPLPKVTVPNGEKPAVELPRKSIAFQRPPATPIVPPKPVVAQKRSWWRRMMGS